MENFLKAFPFATNVRDYLGGKELRFQDLDSALGQARRLIQKDNLPLEIFEVDSSMKSFSVREVKV